MDIEQALAAHPDLVSLRTDVQRRIANCSSVEEVWEVYRSTSLPAGASPIQVHETRRAVFWAMSMMLQILPQRPELAAVFSEQLVAFATGQLGLAGAGVGRG